MKTEISRDSHQPAKRYSGVYQQQGRMLTDADWNELVDILKGRLADALKDITGSREGSVGGTPFHRALKLAKAQASDPLTIHPGSVYVDGLAAQILADVDIPYAEQADFPFAPELPDNCLFYADVWERTLTQLMDERLRDQGLHGADTCTRKEVLCQIKWCPVSIDPEVEAENPRRGDARASISLRKKQDQPDPCDPCAEQLEVESRIGNYLFRVEVHDVEWSGTDLTGLTLKWSAENGAIQAAAALTDSNGDPLNPPAHFSNAAWAYEFFDQTSEKHLGVQHASLPWLPHRGQLVNTTYVRPASAPNTWVRRWDGYCRLSRSGSAWSVVEKYDKDFKETFTLTAIGDKLVIELSAHTIEIELGQWLVAGDFWLAEVREAVHSDGSILLDGALPHGIEHHYLKLGRLSGGVLQDNPEADRKYAFPPLTEMTHVFIAGGDGQDAMPGHELLHPLRVGVANGEWPVSGAKVRFTLESGAGALSLSTAPFIAGSLPLEPETVDGLAQCFWRLGDGITPHARSQRIKAELLGVDGTPLAHPPVYFNANLSTADQVAYQNQGCGSASEPSVQSLLDLDPSVLWPDFDADGDVTVRDVLDALLCKLKANHIPFYPENCAAGVLTPTVKTGLGISDNTQVHAVLQKLLCELRAGIIPYDPSIKGTRWDDVNAEEGAARPLTLQAAIDALVENLQSEDIKYTPTCSGDSPATLRSKLNIPTATPSRVNEILNKLLCEFRATHLPLDLTDTDLCSDLKSADTVQDALKILCDRKSGGGCALVVDGVSLTLDAALRDLKDNINICLMPGTHQLVNLPSLSTSTLKITGSGQDSVIKVRGQLKITAAEIILRDLTLLFEDGTKVVPTAGSGNLVLDEPKLKAGSITVNNCFFTRVYVDLAAKTDWQAVVTIAGQPQLKWQNNRMMAVRRLLRAGKISVRTPIAMVLEGISGLNPYEVAYKQELNKAAAEIISLAGSEKLTGADMETLNAFFAVPAGRRALLSARKPAELQAIADFSAAIQKLVLKETLTRKVLAETVGRLVTETSSPDSALALEGLAEGAVSANHINGQIDLCLRAGETLLDWTEKPNDKLVNIVAEGSLHLLDNRLHSVNFHTNPDELKKLQSAENANLTGYASMTVRDNIFSGEPSSFVAESLQLGGNQFAAAGGEVVVAYGLAKLMVVMGNQAKSLNVILRVAGGARQPATNTLNLLKLV